MQKKLSDAEKQLIYGLYNAGHSQEKIGGFFGVSQATVSKTIAEQRYREQIAALQSSLSGAADGNPLTGLPEAPDYPNRNAEDESASHDSGEQDR